MIELPQGALVVLPLREGIEDLTKSARWSHFSRARKRQYANNEVAAAKRRGQPVGPCALCGATESEANSEAHHPDYEKPWEIFWLCMRDHKRFHASDPNYISKLSTGSKRWQRRLAKMKREFAAERALQGAAR